MARTVSADQSWPTFFVTGCTRPTPISTGTSRFCSPRRNRRAMRSSPRRRSRKALLVEYPGDDPFALTWAWLESATTRINSSSRTKINRSNTSRRRCPIYVKSWPRKPGSQRPAQILRRPSVSKPCREDNAVVRSRRRPVTVAHPGPTCLRGQRLGAVITCPSDLNAPHSRQRTSLRIASSRTVAARDGRVLRAQGPR
jgi:hypothetical protein